MVLGRGENTLLAFDSSSSLRDLGYFGQIVEFDNTLSTPNNPLYFELI